MLAQYESGANLRSRVSVYEYLEPVPTGSVEFGPWVLDHIAWSGTEVALDVGGGPDSADPGLSARAARVVGLDISPGMLREHRDGRPSTSFVQADAVDLPARVGSFDVVLAAHMLYHLSDIERALAEVRRVLRRGGAFLASLNGATDKHEIRELWQESASKVLGASTRISHWSSRANLDNMPEVFEPQFADITVDRLAGRFRFPSPEPVLRWVASFRSGTEDAIDDDQWEAAMAELGRRVGDCVREHGELVVTKEGGVIVAR